MRRTGDDRPPRRRHRARGGPLEPGLLPALPRQGRAAARRARRRAAPARHVPRAPHGRGRTGRAAGAPRGSRACSSRRATPTPPRTRGRSRSTARGSPTGSPTRWRGSRELARGAAARRRSPSPAATRDRDADAIYHLAIGAMEDALVARRRPIEADVEHLVQFALGRAGMEREVLLTGIGGQGVQLAAQVLARGATLEGRHVMFFGVYGGTMRGMNTDGTVVVADGPLQSPPLVSRTWSAIAMHDGFWAPVAPKLRPGGARARERRDVRDRIDSDRYRVVRVPATEIAAELGNALGGSMVMVGAYAGSPGSSASTRRRGDARVDPVVPAAARRRERGRAARRLRRGRARASRRGSRRCGVSTDDDQGARHRHDRRRGVQGLRAVHPGVPAARAGDVERR